MGQRDKVEDGSGDQYLVGHQGGYGPAQLMVGAVDKWWPKDDEHKANWQRRFHNLWHQGWLCQSNHHKAGPTQGADGADEHLGGFRLFIHILQHHVALVGEQLARVIDGVLPDAEINLIRLI